MPPNRHFGLKIVTHDAWEASSRRFLVRMIKQPCFDQVILVCILVSTVVQHIFCWALFDVFAIPQHHNSV